MFCITHTTIQKYIKNIILSFVAITLFVIVAPLIGPVFAETEGHVSLKKDTYFPISEDNKPLYEKWVVATAYSSDPRQTDNTPCIPAMNFDLCAYFEEYGIEDTIAANFLPLGTQVKFPELYGDKIFVVRDRMNARYNKTNRIDFWVGSERPTSKEIVIEAKNKAKGFGVKRVRMEVYAK